MQFNNILTIIFTNNYLNFVQLIYHLFILILVKINCIVIPCIVKREKAVISVLYYLYDYLTIWFAPVLCHTMEEAWKELKTENLESVHLKNSKEIPLLWKQDDLINKWKLIRKVRRQVNTAIEQVRNKKLIDQV